MGDSSHLLEGTSVLTESVVMSDSNDIPVLYDGKYDFLNDSDSRVQNINLQLGLGSTLSQ